MKKYILLAVLAAGVIGAAVLVRAENGENKRVGASGDSEASVDAPPSGDAVARSHVPGDTPSVPRAKSASLVSGAPRIAPPERREGETKAMYKGRTSFLDLYGRFEANANLTPDQEAKLWQLFADVQQHMVGFRSAMRGESGRIQVASQRAYHAELLQESREFLTEEQARALHHFIPSIPVAMSTSPMDVPAE